MFFDRRIPSWLRVTYYYDSRGAVLYGLFFGLTIYFFTVIARRIKATDVQIALLTVAPFVGALFAFYWSHHSSQRRKMPFLIRIQGIARGMLLLMALAVNPWLFVILVLLHWFFETAGTPAYSGIVRDIYPTEYRGRAMGYVRVELALAAVLATYVGGRLLNISTYSYRWVFPIGAVLGLVSLLFFKKIKVRSDDRVKRQSRQFSLIKGIKILQSDRSFYYYELIFFLFGCGWLIAAPLYPICVVDVLKLSNAAVGKVGAVFSLFWIVSYLFWGQHIDRNGPLKARCIVILLFGFVPLCYFFASKFQDVGFWLIAFAAVLIGLASGGGELSRFNYLTRIATEDEIQFYWGIDFTLMGIRGVFAPFVGIHMKSSIGMEETFLISFLMVFVGAILMVLFAKKEKYRLMRREDDERSSNQ